MLNSGAQDDLLTASRGHDTFVFAGNFGHDAITDFAAANHEKIDLTAVTGITSFADLVNNHHIIDDPGGNGYAMIDDGAGNTILLEHVHVSDIGVGQAYSAADFLFSGA